MRETEVPFSMTIGNEEFMQEYLPKHSRTGTERMKSVRNRKRQEERRECGKKESGHKKEAKAAYHYLLGYLDTWSGFEAGS